MKYKLSNEKFRQLVFKLLNNELEQGRFGAWVGSYGYSNLRVNDEYDGLMVLVDDEDIRIYPALYQNIMEALGMNIYQIEEFLHMWATTELPKKMPLGKKYFLSDKFVEIMTYLP